MTEQKPFWVVGIGASAGGLEALTQFVSALPAEGNACYVVAQHLAPHAKSMMVELIARQSPIPVDVVTTEMTLVANKLFIVPPNYDVDVVGDRLVLTKAGDETRPKPSVDRFFKSLAQSYGESVVGIILSGTGSDGSEGTRAIKEVGGVTMAQEEGSAKFSGMPNAAFETGQVDFVLSPPEIAKKLTEIVSSKAPFIKSDDAAENTPGFEQIISLIKNELGNDFSQYKLGTIKRRLAKRMTAIGVGSIDEYLAILSSSSAEVRALAQEFLVSVTSFFRDPETFETLTEFIKELVSLKSDGDEFRIWSAGCATGEEAYSLAILANEVIEESGKKLILKVFATDLDTDAISKARIGVYGAREVLAMAPGLVEKYFEQHGEVFEAGKILRERLIFARQDLVQSPPFVKLDLVCCRNVIIYFEPDLQRRIFEIFNYSLKPGGILFLGKSEAITGATELFEPIDKRAKIFRKIVTKVRVLPTSVRTPSPILDQGHARRRVPQAPTPVQLAQTQILERYSITGAIVNAEGAIDTVLGDVSSYLKIPPGVDNFRLQTLLPKSAAVEFQLLLNKAVKFQTLQISRAFKAPDSGDVLDFFQIQISPLDKRETASTLSQALFLVTFDKIKSELPIINMPSAQDGDLALRVAELEQELAATKEHLQTVIEELGVTNEELQSTNEELSSTNEELQSSNEELETTNEEFQSTNEELTTVNDELQVKSGQLRSAFTDLENIQVSVGVPMLVVDDHLKLQRFNPSTTELFDITLTDVGRSIAKLSCRCEIENFAEKVRSVIETGQIHESQVEAFRSVYQMRVTPRRSDKNRIVGAVIIFFNNTNLIRAEASLRKNEQRMRGILDGSASLVFLKDMAGKYISVNAAFEDYFHVKESAVVGKLDKEIFGDAFAHQLRNGDLEAILRRARVEKQEDFTSPTGTASFLVSRFPLVDQDTQTTYGVGTVAVDITMQVQAQAALKKSESLYRGVVEDQTVFVMRYDAQGIVTFVNAAFVRYFGGAASEYVGQPLYRIVDSNDRAMVKEGVNRLNRERTVVQLEHRFTQYGGSQRWVRWISKAVLDSNDDLLEIQAVGFDVTESRQQTDQMVQREMLFSNIFTYTTDFLTVFRVTQTNELLLESFNRTVDDGAGYTYAQFLGRNVRDLVTSSGRATILEKYRECVEKKTPQAFDEELLLQGSTKFLSTTVIPVLNNQGVVERVVTLSRDISKYKIAEAELNAAKAAAEVANESKSDFLASMSHELRSPLNVVIGMSELLQESVKEGSEREQVKSIQRSGKVLLTLIEDILDISKIEAGKTKFEYSNFSIRELIDDVTESFRLQTTQKGITLQTKFPNDGVDYFIGDVNRVRQVLTNLVSNAVKFTDSGGVTIAISTVGHKSTGRRLVRFEVKDTGIGIPEEYHSRIFKKFSQVDSGLGRRYGGTGLGLVISQRLTTLMSGTIGFSSEWNRGSTFWFELPLTMAKKSADSKIKTAEVDAIPKRLREIQASPVSAKILAVDDSPDSRMLLQMLLNRLGHKCTMVDSGEAAIDEIQKDEFDLVLMDVQMPGMDGYESTTRIRRLEHVNKNLPIIALTANAMVGDSEKCFDAGMNDYVTKPINSDLLRGVILKWATRASARASEKKEVNDR